MHRILYGVIGGLALSAATTGVRAPQPLPVKLTGIVAWEKKKLALLEIVETGRMSQRFPLLREGDKDGLVEVLEIHPGLAQVKVRLVKGNAASRDGIVVGVGTEPAPARGQTPSGRGEDITLNLDPSPAKPDAEVSLHFQGARSQQVLFVYQILAARTVIAPTTLRTFAVNFQANAADSRQAVRILDQALAAERIVTQLRAEKFVFVVPEDKVALLAGIPDPPVSKVGTEGAIAGNEVFPTNQIRFLQADPVHVLSIYRDLTGNANAGPGTVPKRPITVFSQTQLTRGEAVWLFEALFHLAQE